MNAGISQRKGAVRMQVRKVQRAETGDPQIRPALDVYNGKPMIVLNPEQQFGRFQFGLRKAQMILAALPAIRQFVLSKGNSIV